MVISISKSRMRIVVCNRFALEFLYEHHLGNTVSSASFLLAGSKASWPKIFQQIPAACLISCSNFMEQKPNNAVQTLASHYLNTTLHRVDNKAMVFTSGEIRIGPHLENSNGIFMHDPFVSPRTWSRKQYYCWFTGGTLGHQWQSKVVQHWRGIRPQLATWRKDSYPGMRYSPRYVMIMIFVYHEHRCFIRFCYHQPKCWWCGSC